MPAYGTAAHGPLLSGCDTDLTRVRVETIRQLIRAPTSGVLVRPEIAIA
jgi:hypothetical protein